MIITEEQWIERRKQMRALMKQGAGFLPVPRVPGAPFELILMTPAATERLAGRSWDDVTELAIDRAVELMSQPAERRAA